ncbi:hypothetical protein [Legionella clemsonensis]|uniref:Uncharacterized protein n=1 Tax=Legionella clemsonensis TaxID=1867846 RepID=A0A222P2D1_9GAMM|nr:hypothetical protein [Legionella clemsonensis]ASQ46008.1 hypothetical protein clem_07275 [Legionella clemsonensis]
MKGKEPEEGELEGNALEEDGELEDEKLEQNNESSKDKPPPIVVRKDSEFFIAIGKQDIHSFVMLGVIKEDGVPQLLARVGKTGDVGNACLVTAAIKALGPGAPSRMQEEPMFGKTNKAIAYQAYAISYEQYKEFLELIAIMEKSQQQNPIIEDDAMGNKIKCYIPTRRSDVSRKDHVTLKYRELSNVKFSTEKIQNVPESTIKGVQELHITNTCRTTSINLIEAILGFKTTISKYFFVNPNYQTVLRNGSPDENTFYILPPPPTTVLAGFSDKQKQVSTLEKIYKRLEEIPKKHPEDPATRKKFEALKTIYHKAAGDNTLDATTFLQKILEHERDVLYTKRAPSFFSRVLSLPSSTEKMFQKFEKEFQEESSKNIAIPASFLRS